MHRSRPRAGLLGWGQWLSPAQFPQPQTCPSLCSGTLPWVPVRPSTHITQATTALDTEPSWTPTKLVPPIRGPFPASFFSGASPLAGMETSFLPSSPSTQDASSRRTGPEAASARGPSHTPEQCQAPCQPLQMLVGSGSLTPSTRFRNTIVLL